MNNNEIEIKFEDKGRPVLWIIFVFFAMVIISVGGLIGGLVISNKISSQYSLAVENSNAAARQLRQISELTGGEFRHFTE